jgi:hypothetical protein
MKVLTAALARGTGCQTKESVIAALKAKHPEVDRIEITPSDKDRHSRRTEGSGFFTSQLEGVGDRRSGFPVHS